MAVPTAITDLSATAASNSPAGSDAVFTDLDNFLRAIQAFIRQGDTRAANVASASTADLGAAVGRIVNITGTTTITSFGAGTAGELRTVRFTGILTLTHNGTSLILPKAANIVTAVGDAGTFRSLGGSNWVCENFEFAVASPIEAEVAGSRGGKDALGADALAGLAIREEVDDMIITDGEAVDQSFLGNEPIVEAPPMPEEKAVEKTDE